LKIGSKRNDQLGEIVKLTNRFPHHIKTGPGKIEQDIKQAREQMVGKYRCKYNTNFIALPNVIEDPDQTKTNGWRMKST